MTTADAPPGLSGASWISGLCFAGLAALFMTVIMLGASLATDYDFAGGAISDLGVMSGTALLFNASLIAVGILNIAGGYLLRPGSWIVAGVASLAGLGAIGAGLFPLDRGDIHSLFALAAFAGFNLQSAALAQRSKGALRWIGWTLAALGLAYVVVMIVGDSGNPAAFGAIGHGGAERMIVYPPMIWLMIFGGSLLADR